MCFARVDENRVVADQEHRPVGHEVGQDEAGQRAAELQAGPAGAGEDPLVGGAMARGEPAEGPEQVGDGVSARGQDGGDEQQAEPPGSGPDEGRGERIQQRQRLGW